jgi:peptide chain release factor 2
MAITQKKSNIWWKPNTDLCFLMLLLHMNSISSGIFLSKLAQEEHDEGSSIDLSKELSEPEKEIDGYELQTLLGEEDDRRNAIVAINAGAGGTEAQDWAEMLFRLYLRWAESKKMKTSVVDYLPGDEAGIKNVTLTVSSPYAYGYLKSEHGVHKMVRVSPFDANSRRHTSFASVSVLKDHRTNVEAGDVERAMNGDIEDIAY